MSSTAQPPATASEATGWNAITAKIRDDGTVDSETALQAFAYVFGPMPGVTLPPGAEEEGPAPGFADAAIRWLLAHRGDLADEQARAAGEYVTGGLVADAQVTEHGGSARSSSRPRGPKPPPKLEASITNLVRQATAAEATKIGTSLGAVTITAHLISVDPKKKGGEFFAAAWTYVSAGKGLVLEDMFTKQKGFFEGPTNTCDVYVPVHTWQGLPTDGSVSLTGHLAEVLYHEAFHCLQGFTIGSSSVAAYIDTPSWISEGSAAWVGADMAKLNTYGGWWTDWLTAPQTSLLQRTYDAIGFYSAIDQAGVGPYTVFLAAFNRNGGAKLLDNATAFKDLSGGAANLPDIWAPTYFREPSWGSDWEPRGLGIPANSVTIAGDITPSTTPATVTAKPYTVELRNISAPPVSTVVEIVATTPVRVRDPSGQLDRVGVTRISLCFANDGCAPCPPEQDPAHRSPLAATAPVSLAATGMAAGATVTVVAASPAENCQDRRPGGGGSPAGGSGGSGGGGGGDSGTGKPADGTCRQNCGKGTGEPHMETIDGFSFDFQAAGEFVTLTAGDGFEVQTRQEMVSGRTDVSVNTAVAMDVASDRVAVYARGGVLEVRLDGTPVSADQLGELPHGGTVVADSGGFTVVWPDGSAVWVLPANLFGLDLLVQPAPDRLADAAGLLGPAPGGTLRARDGATATYQSPVLGEQSYDDLYRTFGDSWRVAEADSLFDYTDKSHDDLDQRQFPEQVLTVADIPAADRDRGETACISITDHELHADCVFDVAVTGSDAMATSYRAIAAVVSAAGSLAVGDEVSDASVKAPEVDQYRLIVDRAQVAYFRHGETANETGIVEWHLIDPAGQTFRNGINSDFGRIDLVPGVYTIDVVAPEGSSAEYGFEVIAVAPDEEFDIDVDDTVSPGEPTPGAGDLATWGAREVYRFRADQGERVTLSFTDCTAASSPLGWTLEYNAVSVAGGSVVCDPLNPIELPATGEYTLTFTAQAVGPFSYLYDLGRGIEYDGRYSFVLAGQ